MTELVITTQVVLLVALSFCLRQIVRLQRRLQAVANERDMYRDLADALRSVKRQ